MMTYTLDRPLTAGASAFDVLQYKITALENAKAQATDKANSRAARLDYLHARLEAKDTPRRERLSLEGDLAAETSTYYREVDKVQALVNEIKGFRKCLDTIIILSQTGGVLNENNKNHVSNILNY